METIKINKYEVKVGDTFIFDTNVWIFLFAPIAEVGRVKQERYSNLLKEIRSRSNTTIFITSLIISEYINRVLRMYFELWKIDNCKENVTFKRDYRHTDDYKQALQEVNQQVYDILSYTQRYSDNFHNADIKNVILPRMNNCDYNDSYLIHSCSIAPAILVSDDQDLLNIDSNVKLLTI